MKKIIASFIFILGLAFWQAGFVFADGMVLPPPGKFVQETDQKAVIFHEDGMEHLVIQIAFQGDAEEFAWVVPTPSKPEVTKSTDTLFTSLEDLTGESPQVRRPANLGVGALENDSKGVTVIEEKQIDYYDVAVLEASDNDALYNWLNDNGYSFPSSGKQIADEYIQNDWYFTAVKISPESEGRAQGQLASGHSTPLMLSFETEKIVYPLKISSISGAEDNAPEGEIMYIDGQEGKAAHIDSDRMVATDKIVEMGDFDRGAASFHLKKRNDEAIKQILTLEASDDSGNATKGITVSNGTGNQFSIIIRGNYREAYQVNLGSDFKENQWQEYEINWKEKTNGNGFDVEFLIDGKQRTLEQSYSTYNSGYESGNLGRLALGGYYYDRPFDQGGSYSSSQNIRRKSPSHRVFRNADILIDEASISIGDNNEQIISASFEENLKVLVNGEESDLLVYNESSVNDNPRIMGSDRTGVLLYIFSDKMQKVPGFKNTYSGWLTGDQVENLARIDGGSKPWKEASSDKYFLTKLYQTMSQDEMTEDLYPQEMETPGYTSSNTKMIWVIILIAASVFVTIGVIFVMIRREKLS